MFGKIPAALLGVTFFLLQSQASVASDSDPSWSPDGKKIVFMSNRDGDIEIYVANTDGTGVQRLTYAPARDAHRVFSRDGNKIAFQSPRTVGTPVVSENSIALKTRVAWYRVRGTLCQR